MVLLPPVGRLPSRFCLNIYLFITRSQVDTEPIETELEEKLNLRDEKKQAEVEDGEKAAPSELSNPEPTAVVEASYPPAPVVEAAPEEDVDPRQHLNVVFIGHVGKNYAAASLLRLLLFEDS